MAEDKPLTIEIETLPALDVPIPPDLDENLKTKVFVTGGPLPPLPPRSTSWDADDIQCVMDQTQVTREQAISALIKNKNIVDAILDLTC